MQLCAFGLVHLLFIKKQAGRDGNSSVFSLTNFPEGTSELKGLERGAL